MNPRPHVPIVPLFWPLLVAAVMVRLAPAGMAAPGDPLWTLPGFAAYENSPAVDDQDVLYCVIEDVAHAVDTATGKFLWSTPVPPRRGYGSHPVLLPEARVLVPGTTPMLLEASTGKSMAEGIPAAEAVVVTEEGQVITYDYLGGTITRYRHFPDRVAWTSSSGPILYGRLFMALSGEGDIVVGPSGSMGPGTTAVTRSWSGFDGATGTLQWRQLIPDDAPGWVYSGMNGAIGWGHRLYAFTTWWQFSGGGVSRTKLEEMNPRTGVIRLRQGHRAMDAFGEPILGPDGTLFIGTWVGPTQNGSNGAVLAINGDTGLVKWRSEQLGNYRGGALASDGTLYFGSGKVFGAIDSTTGRVLWRRTFTGSYTVGAPALTAKGVVIAPMVDGLYAFEGTTGLANSPWPKSRGDAANSGRRHPFPPRILSPRHPEMFSGGGDVRIVLDADAEPPPSVQWFRNELPVAGVDGLELRFNPFLEDHAGTYSAVISNRLGVARMPPFKILWNGQRMLPVLAIQSSDTSLPPPPIETSGDVRGPWSLAANELTSSDRKWRLFEAVSSEAQFLREAGVSSRISLQQGVAIEAAGTRAGLHRVDYVEESSQWEEWKPLIELRIGEAPVWIFDEQNTNRVKRFYRVVSVE